MLNYHNYAIKGEDRLTGQRSKLVKKFYYVCPDYHFSLDGWTIHKHGTDVSIEKMEYHAEKLQLYLKSCEQTHRVMVKFGKYFALH